MKNKISRLLLQSIILIALSLNALSQPATSLVKVIVSPIIKTGHTRLMKRQNSLFRYFKYGNLMENVTIDYETGPETLPDVKKEGCYSEKRKNRIFRNYESSRFLPCKSMGSC